MNAEERFARLVNEVAHHTGVEVPGPSRRGFGSQALKVNGSIFAMLTGGRLVVKLPAQRVEELIRSAIGSPFESGKGRPMKEWVAVTTDDEETWLALAREALDYVGAHPPRQ